MMKAGLGKSPGRLWHLCSMLRDEIIFMDTDGKRALEKGRSKQKYSQRNRGGKLEFMWEITHFGCKLVYVIQDADKGHE